MRSIRNPRFAPELLERKLSLSSITTTPPPAEVGSFSPATANYDEPPMPEPYEPYPLPDPEPPIIFPGLPGGPGF